MHASEGHTHRKGVVRKVPGAISMREGARLRRLFCAFPHGERLAGITEVDT